MKRRVFLDVMNEWVIQNNGKLLNSQFHNYTILSLDKVDIDRWCDERFGTDSWVRICNKYWFSNPSDYMLFTLTWGN